MVTGHDRFKPNKEEIAAKVMDGEAVFINVSTGVYYSIDGIGGIFWEMIAAGHSLDEIADALVKCCGAAGHEVREHLKALASDLLKEKIVSIDGQAPRPAVDYVPQHPAVYRRPVLGIYRDMQ